MEAMAIMEEKSEEPLKEPEKIIKPLEEKEPSKALPILVVGVALFLGVSSGIFLYKNSGKVLKTTGQEVGKSVSQGTVVGSTDVKTFRDCASGELAKNEGKITEEGSHKLIRPGGESQTVYITSSVVDLDQFLGKNVEACGETFKGQKAGWLMDVGRIIIK